MKKICKNCKDFKPATTKGEIKQQGILDKYEITKRIRKDFDLLRLYILNMPKEKIEGELKLQIVSALDGFAELINGFIEDIES